MFKFKRQHPTVKYWEADDIKELHIRLIGYDYGNNPLERLADIQRDKSSMVDIIARDIKINKEQIGLEIGGGAGYTTKPAALKCKHLHACDISRSYLKIASDYCKDLNNVTFHLIEPCDLSPLSNYKFDFVYSNNVFIHLTFYEIVMYLQEIKKIINPGAYVWFDFIEIERLDITSNSDFDYTLAKLKSHPLDRGCIQFNSSAAIFSAAEKLGFKISSVDRINRCNLHLLLHFE